MCIVFAYFIHKFACTVSENVFIKTNIEVNWESKCFGCNSCTSVTATSADVCICSLSQTIMVKTIISRGLDLGALSTWTRSIVHRLSWIVLHHSTSTIMHGGRNQHTTCSKTNSGMQTNLLSNKYCNYVFICF